VCGVWVLGLGGGVDGADGADGVCVDVGGMGRSREHFDGLDSSVRGGYFYDCMYQSRLESLVETRLEE